MKNYQTTKVSLRSLMEINSLETFEELCELVSKRLYFLTEFRAEDEETITKTVNLLVKLGDLKEAFQKAGVQDASQIADFVIVEF